MSAGVLTRCCCSFTATAMGFPRVAAALLLLAGVVAARKRSWSPDDLSEPLGSTDETVCTRGYGESYVCDPDGLLSRESRRALDRNMAILRKPQRGSPTKRCGGGYEVRAAVVRYITRDRGESASSATEKMTQSLLMDWDLGDCGAVLFVSMGDRRVFIATGEATSKVLSSRALRTIIAHMTPYLKRNNPGRALLTAIHDMEHTLRPISSSPIDSETVDNRPSHDGSSFWGWELKTTLLIAVVAVALAFLNGSSGREQVQPGGEEQRLTGNEDQAQPGGEQQIQPGADEAPQTENAA